jgi:hypothetical protein
MIEKTVGRASRLVQIKIRMPRGLHQKLARDAARTPALTINAEIVRRLEESYRPDDTPMDWAKVEKRWQRFSANVANAYLKTIQQFEERLDRIEGKQGKEGKDNDKATTTR